MAPATDPYLKPLESSTHPHILFKINFSTGIPSFENRVLRRIFGPTRYEVTGDWRKLHNLYCWPSIIRKIKSRRMRWAGHVAGMEETRNA
jgi:hypothetical protein